MRILLRTYHSMHNLLSEGSYRVAVLRRGVHDVGDMVVLAFGAFGAFGKGVGPCSALLCL